MSNSSDKQPTTQSADNTLRYAFNDADKTIAVGSFISGKIGHKIQITNVSSTVDHIDYLDSGSLLYRLEVTYTNAAHDDLVSCERIV